MDEYCKTNFEKYRGMSMNIIAVFTCFNRKEKTKNCIETLVNRNSNCRFTFVVVDDNSTDGTVEQLIRMKNEYDIHLIEGTGHLFYSGGMRKGMEYIKTQMTREYDYILMMNDDVEFLNQTIEDMVEQSKEQENAVIVGTMQDEFGNSSYGAIKYTKGIYYRRLEVEEWDVAADTFNANCVLIPKKAFKNTEIMDKMYIHSLGDFDYGLSLKRNGYMIHPSRSYVGICNNNPLNGTWTDSSLSRKERVKKKEHIKGAPTKQWFYFLKKNFGIFTASKGLVTPYIRIIIGK